MYRCRLYLDKLMFYCSLTSHLTADNYYIKGSHLENQDSKSGIYPWSKVENGPSPGVKIREKCRSRCFWNRWLPNATHHGWAGKKIFNSTCYKTAIIAFLMPFGKLFKSQTFSTSGCFWCFWYTDVISTPDHNYLSQIILCTTPFLQVGQGQFNLSPNSQKGRAWQGLNF